MKIALVDHSYHQKTRSTTFFHSVLSEIGTLEAFWDDTWEGGHNFHLEQLNDQPFDLIVFFQMMYPAEQLAKLNCQRIVLVPMYDSTGTTLAESWVPYRHYLVVCFSRRTFEVANPCGVQTLRVQYFPNPADHQVIDASQSPRVFFWHRGRDLNPPLVEAWFAKHGSMKFHLHFVPDPGHPTGSPIALNERWTTSEWFADVSSYEALMGECSIYIAPRRREGIGMSFLEAMARGQVVVGLPDGTLDEYVISGVNGILLREEEEIPVGVDWSNLARQARLTVEQGYRDYLVQTKELRETLIRYSSDGPRTQRNLISFVTSVRWTGKEMARAAFRAVRRLWLAGKAKGTFRG